MKKITEQEWLTTFNPYDITHHKACRSKRKRRLFSCASARRVLFLIPDERYQAAVETAERYADDTASEEEMRATRRVINKAWIDQPEAVNDAAKAVLATLAKEAVSAVHGWQQAAFAQGSLTRPDWDRGYNEESRIQCILAHDIFANPFRPVTIAPSWLTANVRSLAQAAYEERQLPEGTLDPHRLGVLADALEESGCDSAEMLAHCRQSKLHVRGCWVLDLLLGRS